MYNANNMGQNAQINIGVKANSKWNVKFNFITSYLAFKGSILTVPTHHTDSLSYNSSFWSWIVLISTYHHYNKANMMSST